MPKLVEVKALDDFSIYLKYSDGLEGEYSLSKVIQQKDFASIRDKHIFNKVSIDKKTNDVVWQEGVSLCKNALYKTLQLKNLMKSFCIDQEKL